MENHSVNIIRIIRGILNSRNVLWQMTKREVVGRYRGSVMGLMWSFFNPILMLTIYTFVFSVVFKARWGSEGESKFEFALILFCGLIVFNLFAECVNRAPSLIVSNVNFVKKVVFPLEILPLITIGAALFHYIISLLVLLTFFLFVTASIQWTVVFVPIVMLPLLLMTLGISWFLASFGVFLRDVAQTIGVLTTVMMFLTPIFYPVTAIPENMQVFIYVNPLTFVVEQMRDVLIWGKLPAWSGWWLSMVVGTTLALLGLFWFQKTRKGFSDVL